MTAIVCKYLEHGACINPDGSVKPCCRYSDDSQYVSSPFKLNDLYSKAKENMAKGIWDKGCLSCYKEESTGNTSMRTNSLKTFDEIQHPQYKFIRGVRPSEPLIEGALTYLELTIGRYCNLKCRMCGPWLSTSWDEDLKHSNSLVKRFYGRFEDWTTDVALPKTIDTMLNLSKDDCKHLNELKITGGEPFLSEYLAEFLQRLVDWGFAEKISLDIFTNTTFIPKKKYIKNFNKFKSVYLNMSIDDIGKRGEFIRKKSDWTKVEEAVAWYCKLHIENKNIYVGVSHTQQLYNVLYFREFIDWCTTHIDKEILKDPDSFFLNTLQLTNPEHLSLYSLSNKQKNKLIELIDKDFESFDFTDDKWNNQVSYSLLQLKNCLKTPSNSRIMNSLDTNTILEEFNKHERIVDVVRQENWATVFPKLKEFFNE